MLQANDYVKKYTLLASSLIVGGPFGSEDVSPCIPLLPIDAKPRVALGPGLSFQGPCFNLQFKVFLQKLALVLCWESPANA